MQRVKALATIIAILTLTGCGSGGKLFGGGTKETRPLAAADAEIAVASAETGLSKSLRALNYAFERKGNDAAGFCLSDLDIDRDSFCGESYARHVLVKWDDCPVFGAGRSSGKIDINNDMDTVPSGTSCDSAAEYSVDHDSTYDVIFDGRNGSLYETFVSVDAKGVFAQEGPPPSSASADVEVLAKGTDPDGDVLYDVQVNSDHDVVWDDTKSPTEAIVNGEADVYVSIKDQHYNVVSHDVKFVDPWVCCHPIGGSVDVSIEIDGYSYAASATFGPDCGDAVVDGQQVQLHACTTMAP